MIKFDRVTPAGKLYALPPTVTPVPEYTWTALVVPREGVAW
jgi:hypothetical protein